MFSFWNQIAYNNKDSCTNIFSSPLNSKESDLILRNILSYNCYRLQTMRRAGILKGIYKHFAFRLRSTGEEAKLFVDLHDTAPLFMILMTGIMLSLSIFIACKCGAHSDGLRHLYSAMK
jgi:hypothetical protein